MVETCGSAGLRVTFRRYSRLNRTASLTARTGRTSELNATARENRLRSFTTVFEAWYPAYSEPDRTRNLPVTGHWSERKTCARFSCSQWLRRSRKDLIQCKTPFFCGRYTVRVSFGLLWSCSSSVDLSPLSCDPRNAPRYCLISWSNSAAVSR